MAAPAPANSNVWNHHGHHSPVEDLRRSDDKKINTSSLEVGMSGMSLLSQPPSHQRKSTESTMSSSPSEHQYESHVKNSSAPSSPSTSEKQQIQPKQLPSPISKPGVSSRNTSSTSPSLSLTPNSVEGSFIATTASPFYSAKGDSGPVLPYLQAGNEGQTLSGHHRREGSNTTFGSFEQLPPDNANTGLMGLDGLSDRGPAMIPNSVGAESPRTRLRNRPPLGQSYDQQQQGSGGHSASTFPNAGGARADTSMDSSSDSGGQLRGFGAIGQLRSSAFEFDPKQRRRASSSEVYPQQHQYHEANRYGSLSSGAQQSHQQSFADIPKPSRHVRSVSQPGPMHPAQQQQYGSNDRLYGAYENSNNPNYPGQASRSASLSHQLANHAYDQQRSGSSMPNLAQNFGNYNGTYPLERRESLDFHVSPGSQSNALWLAGSGSDASYGSPQNYYNHSRQYNDTAMLSSQSMPLSLGLSSSLPSREDDMAHPLMGENIEVPDQPDDLPYYSQGGGGSGGQQLRPPNHSHSLSLDAIPYGTPPSSLPPSQQQQQPKTVYSVKFKRSQRNFVLGPRISRDLKIGTYVKVEADRGEDLGIVVGRVSAEKFSSFSPRGSFSAGLGPPPAGAPSDLKRVLRLATHDEVSLLGMKREEEEELLRICRAKVRQRGLPMHVVDAEYQFDRHKLTFFFEAEGRVDFRELVRDLFSMYKTRIWMQQLDKNTCTSAMAIVSPQTANMQMDYGTPIIAPQSEFADSIMFGTNGGF